MSQERNQTPMPGGAPSGDVWKQALRRAFASKPFLVAVALMALTAFGMGAATQFMQLKFRKVPVPLEKDLESVPAEMGHWKQIGEDEPLDVDIQQTLGTRVYIFRDYVDTRLVGEKTIQEKLLKPGMLTQERKRQLQIIEQSMPKAVVHLAVTYYTGMVDTVAHVPERCYIADGYASTDSATSIWKMGETEDAAGKKKDVTIEVKYLAFEDATGFSSRINKNVAYFFQVNGAMESSPVAVRARLQNLFNANVYYAKVELMVTNLKGGKKNAETLTEAEKVMEDFMRVALPHIQKCLPGGASIVEVPSATTRPTTMPAAGV